MASSGRIPLLPIADDQIAKRLAFRVGSFGRDGQDLPVFGNRESRRLNMLATLLEIYFDRVGVDSLGGEGVCPSGYRPGVRQSLLSVLRWGIRTPRVFRLRCFQAGSKLVNLQT